MYGDIPTDWANEIDLIVFVHIYIYQKPQGTPKQRCTLRLPGVQIHGEKFDEKVPPKDAFVEGNHPQIIAYTDTDTYAVYTFTLIRIDVYTSQKRSEI